MGTEVAIFSGWSRAADRGAERDAIPGYTFFMIYQWTLVGCLVALWLSQHRPWGVLLLGHPGSWGFAAGMALAVAYVVLALIQRRAILRRPELLERLRSRATESEGIVPHTARERRLWTYAAITAGCCEEILFRGFLLAVLAAYIGLVAAVPISALLFGVYHGYYGWQGVLKTAAFGLAAALIALLSDSLIPVIITHAAVDLTSGDVGYHIFLTPAARAETATSSS
jgi:membrane protease YdiL (CAAX protease family)